MKVAVKPVRLMSIICMSLLMMIYFSCKPTPETKSCCDQDPEPKNDYARKLKATNHFLDSATAVEWIARYRRYDTTPKNRTGVQPQANTAAEGPTFPKESESFNRALIKQILCLDSCIGIRILFGINDNNEVRLLLGGIDQEGKLIFITEGSNQSGPGSTGKIPAAPPVSKGLGELGQIP